MFPYLKLRCTKYFSIALVQPFLNVDRDLLQFSPRFVANQYGPLLKNNSRFVNIVRGLRAPNRFFLLDIRNAVFLGKRKNLHTKIDLSYY